MPLFMRELLAELQPGDFVLDLGCGKGSFAYEDYPYLRIAALDVVPPEVAFPAHVEFRLGSAETLPHQDGAFRLVMADYPVLLFRKEVGLGHRAVRHVCTYGGDGVTLDQTAEIRSDLTGWICPHCGRTNIERLEAAQIDGTRLQGDIQAFEAQHGDRLKRALSIPSEGEGIVPLPLSPVELEEWRRLANWSL